MFSNADRVCEGNTECVRIVSHMEAINILLCFKYQHVRLKRPVDVTSSCVYVIKIKKKPFLGRKAMSVLFGLFDWSAEVMWEHEDGSRFNPAILLQAHVCVV